MAEGDLNLAKGVAKVNINPEVWLLLLPYLCPKVRPLREPGLRLIWVSLMQFSLARVLPPWACPAVHEHRCCLLALLHMKDPRNSV